MSAAGRPSGEPPVPAPRPSGPASRRPRGSSQRPPASYRTGRLLDHLADDLAGYRLERTGPASARCLPDQPGPEIEAVERTERHTLMGVSKIEFRCHLGGHAGDDRLRLRHTGALRRKGLAVRPAGAVADRLMGDETLVSAILPLDFRWFELRRDDEGWHAATELMGAAEVAMRLPPTRSYIRLSADQRTALVATLDALGRLLGRS